MLLAAAAMATTAKHDQAVRQGKLKKAASEAKKRAGDAEDAAAETSEEAMRDAKDAAMGTTEKAASKANDASAESSEEAAQRDNPPPPAPELDLISRRPQCSISFAAQTAANAAPRV